MTCIGEKYIVEEQIMKKGFGEYQEWIKNGIWGGRSPKMKSRETVCAGVDADFMYERTVDEELSIRECVRWKWATQESAI